MLTGKTGLDMFLQLSFESTTHRTAAQRALHTIWSEVLLRLLLNWNKKKSIDCRHNCNSLIDEKENISKRRRHRRRHCVAFQNDTIVKTRQTCRKELPLSWRRSFSGLLYFRIQLFCWVCHARNAGARAMRQRQRWQRRKREIVCLWLRGHTEISRRKRNRKISDSSNCHSIESN